MLSHRAAVVVVAFFAVVGAAWFLITASSKKPLVYLSAPYAQSEPVELHQTMQDGVTSFSGTLPSVHSCSSVSTGIAAVGDQNPHVTIVLTLMQPEEPCEEQHYEDQTFTVTFAPGEDTKEPTLDGVTINGVIARYKLIED